jgi:hypothetical protein
VQARDDVSHQKVRISLQEFHQHFTYINLRVHAVAVPVAQIEIFGNDINAVGSLLLGLLLLFGLLLLLLLLVLLVGVVLLLLGHLDLLLLGSLARLFDLR